jgi:hypothetical protein
MLGVMLFAVKSVPGLDIAAWELASGVLDEQRSPAAQIVDGIAAERVILVYRFSSGRRSRRELRGPKNLRDEVERTVSAAGGCYVTPTTDLVQLGVKRNEEVSLGGR